MHYSIIIPVYNAEEYINVAIESVINQTINFIENVELILIDDGSTDRSKEVCLRYQNEYPENIKYLYTENAGPGNARNLGIDSVKPDTDYIGFLDADDYLSIDTLEKVDAFFTTNRQVQLAVIPLYHFERIDTPHRLNYRFQEGDRVINIHEDYKAIHFHIGGCFFNAQHFRKNKTLRFRTDIHFWEDALFINSFLLEHSNYGVVAKPKYFYRKRAEEDSLVSSSWYEKSRYNELIQTCYLNLAEKSLSKYDEIIPYIQFLIVYHIRLYLLPKYNEIIYDVLTIEEQNEFFHEFVKLIQLFDNKYIKEQDMPFYYKDYLINLKKHGWPYKQKSNRKLNSQSVTVEAIKFRFTHLLIEGHFKNKVYMMKPNDQLFVKSDKKVIYLPKKTTPAKERIIWGTEVRNYSNSGFKAKIPIYMHKFQFGLKTEQSEILLNKVNLLELLFTKKKKN